MTAAEYLEVAGHLQASTSAEGRREVSGLALPYGENLERPDLLTGAKRRRFSAESAQVRDNAALFYGHDHLSDGLPIGRVASHTHTDAGLRLSARFADTTKAADVYALTKPDEDGKAVLDRFSVGFYPVKTHLEEDGEVLVYDEVDVFEVSLVPDPAFKSAAVDSVLANRPTHQGDPTMTATATEAPEVTSATAEDVTALSAAVDTLSRQVATLGAAGGTEDAELRAPGRTFGEFLQAVARREDEALEYLSHVETLAADTADLGGHLKDGWVGDLFRDVTKARKVINVFGPKPLPASGMNVEYGRTKATTDTTSVTEQATEGAALAYGAIAFDTATAPVKTYGGWSDMSRQVVERSSSAVVEKFFRALVRKYVQTTEAAVKATLENTANSTEVGAAAHDLATAAGWVNYLVDAALFLEDEGMTLDVLFVAGDRFKTLANLRNTAGEYLLDRNSGSINVPGLSGDLFNVPVVPLSGVATGVVRGAHESALEVWEASGAPFRLQDNDITNLTEAMSLYGYMAHAVTDTAGIVRPNDGLV